MSTDANGEISNEELKAQVRFLAALNQNRLLAYEPYEKQKEFHKNGATYRERCFLAGNQLGKTLPAGMEAALHATGRYPDWWDGKRFDGPTRGWAAGPSTEATRDGVQRILLGEGTEADYGTGTIPKSCLQDVKKSRSGGGAVGQIYIKHVTGGTSYIGFRTYEQELDRWASESLNYVWFDEEPPAKHYSEGLTRLNARQGIAFATLTPLLGMTNFIQMFYPEPKTLDRALTMMTIDDVGHYTEAEKEQIRASYLPHEVEARLRGIPMLGEGRVFDLVTRDDIQCTAFPIPTHWPVLGGLDFGWNHPTGAVAIAWDRDADCIYVTHAYKESKRTPSQMAVDLKGWNEGMLWTWPHDGNIEQDRGSGKTIAEQYRHEGLRMIAEHSTFEDGGHSTEAGLLDMLQRMQSGRFKVFHHLEPWLAEFDNYHRKDGQIVKEFDDLISATRMCVMGKRYARNREDRNPFPTKLSSHDPFSTRAA